MTGNTTLTPERIEEIRKRLEAATKRPWLSDNDKSGQNYGEFIAHAPQDISDLLSAYDALSRDGMPDCVSPECPHYQMNQSRDGMREALVKAAEAYTAARECAPIGDWQGRLDERGWELAEAVRAYHKSLSPDAPRQKEG